MISGLILIAVRSTKIRKRSELDRCHVLNTVHLAATFVVICINLVVAAFVQPANNNVLVPLYHGHPGSLTEI